MKLVVVDLELTCWATPEERDTRMSEILEIGAVRVDLAAGIVTDEFTALVKPRDYPHLSPFCQDLTGIGRGDLKGAPQFPEAYAHFVRFCGSRRTHVLGAWGQDWRGLERECSRFGLDPKHPIETLNLKTLFALRYGQKMGLDRALAHLGLSFEGARHRALPDARAAAGVLCRLLGTAEDGKHSARRGVRGPRARPEAEEPTPTH